MSTHPESVANPLVAACEAGYEPTEIRLLTNPSVADHLETIRELLNSIMTAYARRGTTIETTDLDDETNFQGIIEHFRTPIEAAQDTDDAVAVDVTPGRKFMSALAFQVGMQYGADHVFYHHLASEEYFGELYSTIPRPATELIDFRALLEDQ